MGKLRNYYKILVGGLKQNLAEFLGGFSTIFFYRVGSLAPRPTPIPEDQAFVFISPRGRVAQLYPWAPGTHFSRLLQLAWVTVGLFLFPGHHTGRSLVLVGTFVVKFEHSIFVTRLNRDGIAENID
jgi:hypothetical protein